MTASEIQSELEEAYGTDVSPALISSVIDSVMEAVKEWHRQRTRFVCLGESE